MYLYNKLIQFYVIANSDFAYRVNSHQYAVLLKVFFPR